MKEITKINRHQNICTNCIHYIKPYSNNGKMLNINKITHDHTS